MAEIRTKHRSILERWVVTGTLQLETPAHFGNGDADALTDMPLLFDEASGKPLLTGTSIAGALRNYLRELEMGYGIAEEKNKAASLLFGSSRDWEDGEQSSLIVDDSIGKSAGIELRDGVALDPETRTVDEDKKYDFQLLAAGSTFYLHFELLVCQDQDSSALRSALAEALNGLEKGEITLGARKRRGFGHCKAVNWQVWKYDLQSKEHLLAWLASERPRQETGKPTTWKDAPSIDPVLSFDPKGKKAISKLLDATLWTKEQDNRKTAHLIAKFAVNNTLIIRSGFGESDTGPDTVHLHSIRPEKSVRIPVISGASWTGVLRHRALKIARTLSSNRPAFDETGEILKKKDGKDTLYAEVFINNMFGPSEIKRNDKNTRASRISVGETEIANAGSLVITRVKIDRFTSGALDSALFSEQPIVARPETLVHLDLSLCNPTESEKGLLLLLLKDLWIGDLPIGGESGVGRGRLKGISATFTTVDDTWNFEELEDKHLSVTPEDKVEKLENFVRAFRNEMEKGGAQ